MKRFVFENVFAQQLIDLEAVGIVDVTFKADMWFRYIPMHQVQESANQFLLQILCRQESAFFAEVIGCLLRIESGWIVLETIREFLAHIRLRDIQLQKASRIFVAQINLSVHQQSVVFS